MQLLHLAVRFALRGVPIILGKGPEAAFLFPNALGGRRPGGSISIALGTQRLGALRSQEVGGLGAGLADDPPQSRRVFQHRTGPQHIVIKWLTLVIFVKQRRLQAFFNALLPNIGVAVAQRFPSISLTGVLGVGSSDLSNLLSNGLGWSAGASLLGPLFEWGKNARRVDIERELAKQYLLEYERTVLTAMLEVNNSLVELSTYKEELIANEMKMKAAKNASYLSRQRYYQGVTSYLEVIENQRQEFDARLAYSENYQLLLNSYIGLYKSLGGGWVSEAELEKYAAQVAEAENVDVNTIDRDSLFYSGQVVDFYLTPEQEQQRKEERKRLKEQEKAARKAARKNN